MPPIATHLTFKLCHGNKGAGNHLAKGLDSQITLIYLRSLYTGQWTVAAMIT